MFVVGAHMLLQNPLVFHWMYWLLEKKSDGVIIFFFFFFGFWRKPIVIGLWIFVFFEFKKIVFLVLFFCFCFKYCYWTYSLFNQFRTTVFFFLIFIEDSSLWCGTIIVVLILLRFSVIRIGLMEKPKKKVADVG